MQAAAETVAEKETEMQTEAEAEAEAGDCHVHEILAKRGVRY